MDDFHDIRQLDLLRIDLQLLEAHRRHAGLPDLEAEDEVDAVDANDGDGEMEEVLLEPEPKPEADGMGWWEFKLTRISHHVKHKSENHG